MNQKEASAQFIPPAQIALAFLHNLKEQQLQPGHLFPSANNYYKLLINYAKHKRTSVSLVMPKEWWAYIEKFT